MFAYSYYIPQKFSRFRFGAPNKWENIAGYGASFEVNDGRAELARLVTETDQLAPKRLMCHAKTTVDYQLKLIRDGAFLIPDGVNFRR
jgi:hypothetical protein